MHSVACMCVYSYYIAIMHAEHDVASDDEYNIYNSYAVASADILAF